MLDFDDPIVQSYLRLREDYPELSIEDREALYPNARDMDRHPKVRQHFAHLEIEAIKQARQHNIEADYRKRLREREEAMLWMRARKRLLELIESGDERVAAQVALKVYGGRFTYHTKIAELQAEKDAGKQHPDEPYPEPSGADEAVAK